LERQRIRRIYPKATLWRPLESMTTCAWNFTADHTTKKWARLIAWSRTTMMVMTSRSRGWSIHSHKIKKIGGGGPCWTAIGGDAPSLSVGNTLLRFRWGSKYDEGSHFCSGNGASRMTYTSVVHLWPHKNWHSYAPTSSHTLHAHTISMLSSQNIFSMNNVRGYKPGGRVCRYVHTYSARHSEDPSDAPPLIEHHPAASRLNACPLILSVRLHILTIHIN
jgi:hypothetical protein